jgi:hypothetical protein
MELLHAFFQKIPMAALFISVAIGYWIGKFKIGKFQLGGLAGHHRFFELAWRLGSPQTGFNGTSAPGR